MKSPEALLADLAERVPRYLHEDLVGGLLLSPWFYASLAVVLALQWMLPAKPGQSVAAGGVLHDLFWVFAGTTISIAVITASRILLRDVYTAHLGFLSINGVKSWPWGAKVLLALVFTDFLK